MVVRRTRGIRAQIDLMVRRIVSEFDPERIILFGSRSRDSARHDSDVDLLVVMDVAGSKRDARLAIRCLLEDVDVPLDIVVSRPEDFAWRKDIAGTVEYPATHEGRSLYERHRPHRNGRARVGRKS